MMDTAPRKNSHATTDRTGGQAMADVSRGFEAFPRKQGSPCWSVSELNSAVRDIIENSFMPFLVAGEVGNLTIHRSGHVYMSLKDAKSQVRAVFFRGAARARQMELTVGMMVEVEGVLTVYEPRGEYQLSVRRLRPLGVGDLHRKFEELKARLAAEGLFDLDRKKALPMLPKTIGVVTSPEGAALRDFLRVINRRFPNMRIKIFPSAVQGKGAAEGIAKGIEFFNRLHPVDVLVVTRGGGSIEDLWAFNEEVLARAIAASDIPVISGVGHEVDTTIADLAADLRAATPSAAAERVVASLEELSSRMDAYRRRLRSALELSSQKLARRFEAAAKNPALTRPADMLDRRRQRIDELSSALEACVGLTMERRTAALDRLAAKLAALDPMAVLSRGYAVLNDGRGVPLPSDRLPGIGDQLTAIVAAGAIDVTVEDCRPAGGVA